MHAALLLNLEVVAVVVSDTHDFGVNRPRHWKELLRKESERRERLRALLESRSAEALAERAQLRADLRHMLRRLESKPAAAATVATVIEPYVQPKTLALRGMAIDYDALLQNMQAVDRLMKLYQLYLEEEDLIILLANE